MAPRYDVPKAAPAPLRLVQEFVNTVDLEHDREWLAEWLESRGVRPTPRNLARAAEVREALRELLRANNGRGRAKNAIAALDSAARAAKLTVDFARRELRPEARGLEGVLGTVLVVAFTAMADGSWGRLKSCRNQTCSWAFYDYSKNRSASWCSMLLCGNRRKTRAYRARRRT
jgi:predicted RNA-binding Zn ribbon-like protein